MTGRGAGYCAGYAVPGYANPMGGRGFGFGRGMGFGRRGGWGRGRWWGAPYGFPYPAMPMTAPYPAEMTPQQELDLLRQQAEQMNQTMEQINQRIAELEAK